MQDRHQPDHHLGDIVLPSRRRWRELERRTRRQLTTLFVFLVVLAAGIAAVLTVPLPVSMIAPRIVAAVEARLGRGYNVSIGHAWIDHRGGSLGFRLAQFEIRDPAGNAVLRVPEAVVGLNGDFLIGSRVGATSIRLVQPHLTVRIEKNGEVSLAAAEGAPPLFHLPAGELPEGAPAQLFGLLAAADVTTDPGGPLADLQSIQIDRADLVVDDQRRDTVDRLNDVDIRMMRRRGDGGLVMSAVSSDPGDHWAISATLTGHPGGPRDLDLGFRSLSLSRMVYEAMRGKSPVAVAGTLSGRLSLTIAPDGSVPAGAAKVAVEGLEVVPADPDAAVALASASLDATWDGAAKRLTIAAVDLASPGGHAHFTGQATPVPDRKQSWDYHLAGSRIVLPPARPGDAALPLDAIELDGRLDREEPRIAVDRAVLKGPAISASGQGVVTVGADGAEGEVTLAVGRSPLAALLAVWPKPVADGARQWLVGHVGHATMEKLSLHAKGPLKAEPAPNEPVVTLDAAFSDAAVTLVPGLPPVTGTAGKLTVRGHRFDGRASGGTIRLGDQAIALKDARLGFADVFLKPPPGTLTLHGTGPVAAFGALLAARPLSGVVPTGIDLRRGSGTIDATVTLSGPMRHDVKLASLALQLDATVTDGALDRLPGGHRLSNADLHLAVDSGQGRLRGRGTVDGALVSVAAEAARQPGGGLGKATVTASFDPSKLRALGGVGVKGPVAVRLGLPSLASLDGATVEADLSGAAASLPGVLDKPAGRPGHLAFTLDAGAGGHWQLDNFAFEAAPAAFRGTVELDGDGGFVEAKLSTFRLSPGDDVRLDATKAAAGYRLQLRGGALDVRPLLHELLADAGTPGGPDVTISAKLGTGVGYDGEAIAGLDLALARKGGRLTAFALSGRLGEHEITGALAPARSRLTLTSGDAGAALAFFGIYRRVRGGALTLDLVPGRDATRGTLTLQDFGIVGEAAFGPLIAGGDTGAAAQRVTRFSRMRARFRLASGRLLVDDAAIWGPDIGATLDGNIDYRHDRLDVRGTFVPAYLVNNLFSRLPIIGMILGGGANEGLVGVTFKVAGPLEAPTLSVNPISMVAPGFLRKLFSFRETDLGATASGPSPDGHVYPPAPPDPTAPAPVPAPMARPAR
ncbi:MAG TPA: AsmA-like C-terminal region-containing protein [Hyphomicrobiales bacterium]|nr:AsmA-like C-terminal region-containing protein [Hyphomicrobiales bacterium]